jgi:hypothetical protein
VEGDGRGVEGIDARRGSHISPWEKMMPYRMREKKRAIAWGAGLGSTEEGEGGRGRGDSV